ncbi:hypothetical protein [Bacillus sp. Marseille-P3661]|uniref:hypothetical protein n=1 Tax=Bacillus sp. Marseille-P3661 TaxID=1936234 RepID=UPI000C83F43D|nr:hypothetical protein [Bacillus sp. Marseille-P3661]
MLKVVMIAFLIGLPLALSWKSLNITVKGFIWSNVISMTFVMGWLYANAPTRLCNNYLNDQQILLGNTLMSISLILLLVLFFKVFFVGFKTTI